MQPDTMDQISISVSKCSLFKAISMINRECGVITLFKRILHMNSASGLEILHMTKVILLKTKAYL